MHRKLFLGLDVGSGTAKATLLDEQGQLLFSSYEPTRGRPLQTAFDLLGEVEAKYPTSNIASMTCTGTGGKNIASILEVPFINEVICHTKAVEFFHPQARTIIDIGGEDAKLVLVRPNADRSFYIQDFALNTVCAAGTGAFLEQQAARLGYSIQEFSRLALDAETIPSIAGRCTVFAKSDMIHLQQNGVPDYEIIAGLCFAIVRNLKTNIAKGKTIVPPLVFQGGVAANLGVRRAIRELLVASDQELIIPEHFSVMGAIGAALEGRKQDRPAPCPDRNLLKPHLHKDFQLAESLDTLELSSDSEEQSGAKLSAAEAASVYLGIDVGSVSTKMALIQTKPPDTSTDRQAFKVLAKSYLATAGRPLEAIKTGLNELRSQAGEDIAIAGVGSTGSGRYLCGGFVGADTVHNEITAQATAAAAIVPEVDTIFEIGGQDSKYIRMDSGTITDFAMNKVCAAGTGSFLEEQAYRLGLEIQNFGDLALSAHSPAPMGERCTVFMQSDLVHYQQKGADKPDLAAGLCYSIVHNYLNKVVEQREIGQNIVFQGGTALNKGIVAAFEQVLGREVAVPRHNEITGAIGAALLASREHQGSSLFRGFDLSQRSYSRQTFECQGCSNCCEVQKITLEGEKQPLYFGHRCERYEKNSSSQQEQLPDLIRERESLLAQFSTADQTPGREREHPIAIPRTLFFQEWLPFFSTLLQELGFSVSLSHPSSKKLIAQGSACMVTETCLPLKAAHGHVLDLLHSREKRIFLPQIQELPTLDPKIPAGKICPFVQGLPWTMRAAVDFEAYGAELWSPVLSLTREKLGKDKGWRELADLLGTRLSVLRQAALKAWRVKQDFEERLQERGREVLSRIERGEPAVLLVGRPYNAFDPGMNMDLSRKLRRLGVHTLPMDFLPLQQAAEGLSTQHMYWSYGQKILAAGQLLRRYSNLHPIFITNFACGPDAFILHFFQQTIGQRPFLELEIDEHTADAGVVTRLEAFLDSIKNFTQPGDQAREQVRKPNIGFRKDRVLYIPPMADHLKAFAAAFQSQGADVRLIPYSDEESLNLGRKHTKGKECLPAVLTTGDILKTVQQSDFDPKRSAFFMPASSGPCRFGLYHRLHRLVLDKLDFAEVPVYSPNQTYTLYEELGVVGKDFAKLAWKGTVAVDILIKLLQETRPYVQDVARCTRLYNSYLEHISQAVAQRRELDEIIAQAAKDFRSLPRNGQAKKPVVGLVGEIYVRSNPFANEFIVHNLERLGVEVWLPTIGEWIHYVNHTGMHDAWEEKEYKRWLKLALEIAFQNRIEKRLVRASNNNLRTLPEPGTKNLLSWASQFIDPRFEGEAILSVGKSMDYIQKNVQGLVNVIPFTCMPGGVVDALLKRIKKVRDIPALTISYDGQRETNTQNRLEAFVYQVSQQ